MGDALVRDTTGHLRAAAAPNKRLDNIGQV